MERKIEIADSNPLWKDRFKAEKKKLKSVLGKNCIEVYHIGSTAVRGLKAKPIIDIMVVVNDISLAEEVIAKFEESGYVCEDELNMEGRIIFVKNAENQAYRVITFEKSNQTEIDRHIAVSEYLENHPKISREYANLKDRLEKEYTCDSKEYCDGKAEFLDTIEKDAVKWKNRQKNISTGMAKGMCFGVAIGSAFGLMGGNITMGMCYGICFGMLIGMAIGNLKDRE